MTKNSAEKATMRETLTFFAKLALYLAGLALFGYVVYSLTKSLQIHR